MSMSTVYSKRNGEVLTTADYMARALFHAARGRGRTSPNPMVGAVVVSSEGVVVGQGYHTRAGEPHAEIHALDAAGDRARGATLYSTLEPCSHRTVCVRIVAHRARRRGDRDPNPSFAAAARISRSTASLSVGVGGIGDFSIFFWC